MPISDTKPEIQAMQDRIIMAMSGEQRMKLAYEMCCFSREFAKAGIRRDHPDWPEDKVQQELLHLLYSSSMAPSKP